MIDRPSRLGTTLIAGLSFGLASLPPATFDFARTEGKGWGILVGFAPLAASLAGSLLWWLLISGPGRPGTGRGAAVGAATSVAAQVLAWLFLGLYLSAVGKTAAGGLVSLSWASWRTAGWVTLPIYAAVGAFLGRLQSRAVG